MGVFDKASLALVPDGIKDGKLYSIKPTDGSGDFTFTRGSNLAATRVDENGLIEKGRENLVEFSNVFDTSNTLFNVTVSSGEAGYDGTNNAWKLIKGSSSGDYLKWTESGSLGAAVFTYSIYVKAGSLSYFVIWTTGGNQAYFELTGNGSVTYTQGSALVDSKIESVGNGWYRCSLTTYFNNSEVRFYPTTDGTPGVAGGTSGDFVYIQNFQAEYGLVATEYIDRVGYDAAQAGVLENLPRIDYTGGTPSLLLEPSRTNLIDHSEYFGGYSNTYSTNEVNATISPEGLTNATFFKEDTSTGSHILNKSAIVVAGVYTASVFVKANGRDWIFLNIAPASNYGAYFDLSNGTTGTILSNITSATIEDYGNGWYRCSLTADTATDSLSPRIAMYLALSNNQVSYTGDGTSGVYIFGAQLEAGSYPTSYIPTYGTAATRSNDYKQLNDLISLGLVSNDTFTYFAELNCENIIRDSSTLAIQIGSSPQRILFYNSTTDASRFKIYIQDGTTQIYTLTADVSKICISVQPNLIKVYENGVNVLTTTQNLDLTSNSNYIMYGDNRAFSLKQAVLFPEALSDADCITLTTP